MCKVFAILVTVWAVCGMVSYWFSMNLLERYYQEAPEATESILRACGSNSVLRKLRKEFNR